MKPKYNLKSELIKSFFIIVAWLYIGTWLSCSIFVRGFVPLVPDWEWTVKATDHHGKSASGKLYRLFLYRNAPRFLRVADTWFTIDSIDNVDTHVTKIDKPLIFPYLSIYEEFHDNYYEGDGEVNTRVIEKWPTSLVNDTVFFSNEVFSVSISKKKRNKESMVEKP